MPFPPPARHSALFLLLLTTASPVFADAAPVMRCNVLQDGSYRPVLIIGAEGEKRTFHLGDHGLTATTIYDAERARRFAVRVMGGGAGDFAYGDCFAQGNAGGTSPAPATTVAPPPPPPPPPPPTGGGSGGGCGPSYNA